MKKQSIALLWIFLLLISVNFCKRPDSGKKYELKIRGTTFQRSGDIRLKETELESCLREYKWDNHEIDFREGSRGFITIFVKPFLEGKKHRISVSFEGSSSFAKMDKWHKSVLGKAKVKICPIEINKKYQDIAFITDEPECVSGRADILYSNWYIAISVTPYGEFQPPQYATAEYNRLKKQILHDFLDHFYPYFMQCAEQAQVPVQESSK